MSIDFFLGWIFGLLSSLLSGLVLYWLEGKREIQREKRQQRREDIRTACNWKYSETGKISLRGFDLRGANLSGKDLSKADLEEANLAQSGIWAGKFCGANLRSANFRNATLRGTSFEGATLDGADFTGAKLRRVNFTGAILSRTKLAEAKQIEDCIWVDVIIDESTEISSTLREEIKNQQLSGQEKSREG